MPDVTVTAGLGAVLDSGLLCGGPAGAADVQAVADEHPEVLPDALPLPPPAQIKRVQVSRPTKMASTQWFVLEDLVGIMAGGMRVAAQSGFDFRAHFSDLMDGGNAARLTREIGARHKGPLTSDVHEAIFQSPDPERAITELTSNGVDWSAPGSKVDVHAADDAFEVIDRGRGMDRQTIFEQLIVPKLTDALGPGERNGRFGIGFYTVLRYLVSKECTNPADYRKYLIDSALVEVATSTGNGIGYIIQYAVMHGKICVAVKEVKRKIEKGTRIRVASPKINAANIIGAVHSKMKYGRGKVAIVLNGHRVNAPQPGEREVRITQGVVVRIIPDQEVSETVILAGDPYIERHAGGVGSARGLFVIDLPRETRLSIVREGIEVNGHVSEWFPRLVALVDRADTFPGYVEKLAFLNLVAALASALERDGRNLSELSFTESVRAKVEEVARGKRIYPDEAGLVRALSVGGSDAKVVALAAYPQSALDGFEVPKEYGSGWMEDNAGLRKPVRVLITPDLADNAYIDRRSGVVWISKVAYENCDPVIWAAFFIAAKKLGIHVEWGRLAKKKTLDLERPQKARAPAVTEPSHSQAVTRATGPGETEEPWLKDPLFAPPTPEETSALAGFRFLEERGIDPIDAMPKLDTEHTENRSQRCPIIVHNGKKYIVVSSWDRSILFCEDRGRAKKIYEASRIELIKYKDRLFIGVSNKESGCRVYDVEDTRNPVIVAADMTRFGDKVNDGIFIGYNLVDYKYIIYDLNSPASPVWQGEDWCHYSSEGDSINLSDGCFVTVLRIGEKIVLVMNDPKTGVSVVDAHTKEVTHLGTEGASYLWIDVLGDTHLLAPEAGSNRLVVFHRNNLRTPLAVFESPERIGGISDAYSYTDTDGYQKVVRILRSQAIEDGEIRSRFMLELCPETGVVRLSEGFKRVKEVDNVLFVQRHDKTWVLTKGTSLQGQEIFPPEYEIEEIKYFPENDVVVGLSQNRIYVRSLSEPALEGNISRGATPNNATGAFGCGEHLYIIDGSGILIDAMDRYRVDINTTKGNYSRRYAVALDSNSARLISLADPGVYKDFGPQYRIVGFKGGFWILADEDAKETGEDRFVLVEEGTWKEVVVHNLINDLGLEPHGVALRIAGDDRIHYIVSPDEGVHAVEMGGCIASDHLGRLVMARYNPSPQVMPLSAYTGSSLPVENWRQRRPLHIFDRQVWQKLADPKYQARVLQLKEYGLLPIEDHIHAALHAPDALWKKFIGDRSLHHLVRYLNSRGFEAYCMAHPEARGNELELVGYLDQQFGTMGEGAGECFVEKMDRLFASSIDVTKVYEDLRSGHTSEDASAVKAYLESNDNELLTPGRPLIQVAEAWEGETDLARAVGEFNMGRTGRFKNFETPWSRAAAVDRRAVTHVVEHLRVGSPFAFMGPLTRGARKRLGSKGTSSINITTTLVDGKMQIGIEFPEAIGERDLIEELVHINGHEFGRSLLNSLRSAEWIRVESSDSGILGGSLRAEVARADRGEFSLRWQHGRSDSTSPGTTKIEIRMAGKNPFLDAARFAVHIEEMAGYYTGGEIILNGRKLNEGMGEARLRAHVRGLGNVALYEGYGERLFVGGVRVMDIPAPVMDSVAEGIRTLFGRQGFIVDIDEGEVGLVPSGDKFVDEASVLDRLKGVLPGLLVRAFLSRVADPRMREDLRSLPDLYFEEAYKLASEETLGASLIQDARAINRGRLDEVDYSRYADERELLKLMTAINFIPHRGRLISVRDLYRMAHEPGMEAQVKATLPLLPAAVRQRIEFELERRPQKTRWREEVRESGPGREMEWRRTDRGLSDTYALYLEFLELVIAAYYSGSISTGVQTYSAFAGILACHGLVGGTNHYRLMRTLSDKMESDVREFVEAIEDVHSGRGREKWDRTVAKTVEMISHELTHFYYTDMDSRGAHYPVFYLHQLHLIPRATGEVLDSGVILAEMLQRRDTLSDLATPPWQEAITSPSVPEQKGTEQS